MFSILEATVKAMHVMRGGGGSQGPASMAVDDEDGY
jgi:hypothetical protein